jgi:hypothetical protein
MQSALTATYLSVSLVRLGMRSSSVSLNLLVTGVGCDHGSMGLPKVLEHGGQFNSVAGDSLAASASVM